MPTLARYRARMTVLYSRGAPDPDQPLSIVDLAETVKSGSQHLSYGEKGEKNAFALVPTRLFTRVASDEKLELSIFEDQT